MMLENGSELYGQKSGIFAGQDGEHMLMLSVFWEQENQNQSHELIVDAFAEERWQVADHTVAVNVFEKTKEVRYHG
jgi:hypothetical protein